MTIYLDEFAVNTMDAANGQPQRFEMAVGLEVHAELATRSKLFCRCENAFGGEPNTRCCPVCTGMPGALPVLNQTAVEDAMKLGLALGCRINRVSQMDRKHYFYPDLPKAYQISQQDVPICEDGYLDVLAGDAVKRVGITRIHLEEDAGKLVHNAGEGTLVDYNRCGVPLVEIVSEPDLHSADEAKAYMEGIAAVLRCLGVSDVKMQEGSLRADVNVSVRPGGQTALGVRVEMKNLNSFSAVHRAIVHEAARQEAILAAGGAVPQETRHWDDTVNESRPLRAKEAAGEYLFFPDPDLLPFVVEEGLITELRAQLPELPLAKTLRYHKEHGLPLHEAGLLAGDEGRARFFDETLALGACAPKTVANWLLGGVAKLLNERGNSLCETKLTPQNLCGMIRMVETGAISGTAAKDMLLPVLMDTGTPPEKAAADMDLSQISGEAALAAIVEKTLAVNEAAVADYHGGKQNALGFLVGQCMKESTGRANPAMLKTLVARALEKAKPF